MFSVGPSTKGVTTECFTAYLVQYCVVLFLSITGLTVSLMIFVSFSCSTMGWNHHRNSVLSIACTLCMLLFILIMLVDMVLVALTALSPPLSRILSNILPMLGRPELGSCKMGSSLSITFWLPALLLCSEWSWSVSWSPFVFFGCRCLLPLPLSACLLFFRLSCFSALPACCLSALFLSVLSEMLHNYLGP